MADTTTPNLGLTKPEEFASDDTWGDKLNENFDLIDAAVGAAGAGNTFSAASNVDIPLITGDATRIVIRATPSTGTSLRARLSVDSAASYLATGYKWAGHISSSTASPSDNVDTSTGAGGDTTGATLTLAQGASMALIEIVVTSVTGAAPQINIKSSYLFSSGEVVSFVSGATVSTTTLATHIRIQGVSGSLTGSWTSSSAIGA